MKPLTLPDAPATLLSLRNEIQRSAESRYQHRLHALLLVAQGVNCCRVAELLGDDRRTVQHWVHRFETRGLDGLQERARRGRPPRLTPQQAAQIQKALVWPPSKVGLYGKQWDGETLAAYIKRAYGVKLGSRQCRRFFERWALERVKQSAPLNRQLASRD